MKRNVACSVVRGVHAQLMPEQAVFLDQIGNRFSLPALEPTTTKPGSHEHETRTSLTTNPDSRVRRSVSELAEDQSTAAAPRFSEQAKEPNANGNYRVIERLATQLLYERAFEDESELIDEVKAACASHGIDYGRHPDVAHDVVHRACASANVKRRLGLSPRKDGA